MEVPDHIFPTLLSMLFPCIISNLPSSCYEYYMGDISHLYIVVVLHWYITSQGYAYQWWVTPTRSRLLFPNDKFFNSEINTDANFENLIHLYYS